MSVNAFCDSSKPCGPCGPCGPSRAFYITRSFEDVVQEEGKQGQPMCGYGHALKGYVRMNQGLHKLCQVFRPHNNSVHGAHPYFLRQVGNPSRLIGSVPKSHMGY